MDYGRGHGHVHVLELVSLVSTAIIEKLTVEEQHAYNVETQADASNN